MARFSLVGGSYTSQALNADCQRTLNWFPEQIESGTGKAALSLMPSPGLSVFAQVADTPVRGIVFAPTTLGILGRCFAVIGAGLYEILANGTANKLAAVINDGKPAYLAYGPQHLLVASGTHAYVMVLATNVVTDLTAATMLPNIGYVGWNDSFFLALENPRSDGTQNKLYASSPGDATSWPGGSFFVSNTFPDQCLAIATDHRQTVLCGPKTSVFLYDAGDSPFPLDVVPGGSVELNITDPGTLAKNDQTVFLVGSASANGQDQAGGRMGWRVNNFSPQRITTHAVEAAWDTYPKDGTAVAYSFQYLGHSFWHVFFPTANQNNGASWRYDVATGLWHEVDHFVNGVSKAHQSRCHAFAFGKHLVGAWDSGTIYDMEQPAASGSLWKFCDDAGNPIRRLRRSPILSVENQWMRGDELIIDVQPGMGPIPPLTTDGNPFNGSNGRDPQLMLRWSDTFTKTWSNLYMLNCGQAGNYKARARRTMLGMWRSRVFEISATDAIPWYITDGYIKGSGNQYSERLPRELAKRA